MTNPPEIGVSLEDLLSHDVQDEHSNLHAMQQRSRKHASWLNESKVKVHPEEAIQSRRAQHRRNRGAMAQGLRETGRSRHGPRH